MRNVLMTVAVALLTLAAMVAVAHERQIPYAELPQKARNIIEKYFARDQVISIEEDNDWRKEYEVRFSDGAKIDFDGNGDWIKVRSSQGAVPAELVPDTIVNQTRANYPNAIMVEVERDDRGYEIDLSDDRELRFDSSGQMVKVDD